MGAVALEVGREAGPCEVDEDFDSVDLVGVDAVGKTAGVWVDVSTTVVACAGATVDPSLEADLVVREVLKMTVGVCEVGGADDADDADDEGGGDEEDGGNVDGDGSDGVGEIVVSIVVDGVLVDVIGGLEVIMIDVVVEGGTNGGVAGRGQ